MFDDSIQVSQKTEDLRLKLEKHLGVKAASFSKAVRRAGRALPGRLRKQAHVLIKAEEMAAHPKLARRIDNGAVQTAFRDINLYLDAQDLSEQRKTRLLNLAAGIALNLLIVGALAVIVLRWRGVI
ncbi:MAG: hypothetical protein AB8B62_13630 [Roseobacter sp.]